MRPALGHEPRIPSRGFGTASPPLASRLRPSRGSRNRCLYCPYEDTRSLDLIPDDELLRRLVELLRQSRRAEADLVAHIGEVDARRLYAREASPSMFAYCTETLHLSEAEAYLRIAAARASREHPVLLTMLASGRLHLTAIAKLAPHLTAENRDWLLERAVHRTKRQIEELVAEIAPRPDAPTLLRRLPDRRSATAATPLTLATRRLWRPWLTRGPRLAQRPRTRAPARSRVQPLQLRANCVQTELMSPIGTASRRSSRKPGSARSRESRSARDHRTPGAGPLQGPVHRQRRAPRQARQASRAHALLGARRRPGGDHRRGRHREARAARSAPLRPDEGSPEGAFRGPDAAFLAPRPGGGPEGRLRAGRRPVPLRRRPGSAMRRPRGARVSSPPPVRIGRPPFARRAGAALSHPQWAPGRDRLRPRGRGEAPPLRRRVPDARRSKPQTLFSP